MSSNKNLVAAGFTLMAFFFLVVASHGDELPLSYGGAGLCGERTGFMCTSEEMCVTLCLQKKSGGGGGYTGGYCSTEHVVGDPSCVCTRPCKAPRRVAVGVAN